MKAEHLFTHLRNILSYLTILLFLSSCNQRDNKLKSYYQNNSELHQEISDSLISFSKRYQTDVVLKRINYPEKGISFGILFHDRATIQGVYFDAALNRHDDDSRTANFVISENLIELFKRSIYIGIGSDSTYTFFANKWDKPKYWIGTSGDSQFGILILKDTAEIDKRGKRISKNACLSHYTLF